MPVLGEINCDDFPSRANPKMRPTPRRTPHKLAFKRQGSCSNPCLARDPNGGLGAYKIGKLLGSGSFGEVYLAHKGSNAIVLKRIPSEKSGKMYGAGGVATTKEIQYQKKLSFHPCVVQYLSHFEEQGHLYIALDYCSGGDLKNWASKNHDAYANGQILDFACQMSLALKATHDQRIIHRDVKVHNFFLTSSGRIKMGDWGFAQSMKGGSISHGIPGIADDPALMLYTQQGTPYYIAPEQCAGEPYNSKIDVWAFGCAIYELCTNEPPFKAGCASNLVLKILRACPTPVSAKYCSDIHLLISACLQRDPINRPSFDELLCLPCIKSRIATFMSPEEIYRDFKGDSTEIVNGSGGSALRRNMSLPKWSKTSGNVVVVYASKGHKSAARDGNACVHPGKYGEGCWYKGDFSSDHRWHGSGIAVYPNGDIYSGSWKNDAWDGHGAFFGSDGESFIGAFNKDTKTNEGRPATEEEKMQVLEILEKSKGVVEVKAKKQRKDETLDRLNSPIKTKSSLNSSISRMSPRNLGSSLKKNVMGLFKRNKGAFNVSSKRDSPVKKRVKVPKRQRMMQEPQIRGECMGEKEDRKNNAPAVVVQTKKGEQPQENATSTKSTLSTSNQPKSLTNISKTTDQGRMEGENTVAEKVDRKFSKLKIEAKKTTERSTKDNADVPFGLPISTTPLRFKTPSKSVAGSGEEVTNRRTNGASKKVMTFLTPASVKISKQKSMRLEEAGAENLTSQKPLRSECAPGKSAESVKFTPVKRGFIATKSASQTPFQRMPEKDTRSLKFTPVKGGFAPLKPLITNAPKNPEKASTSTISFTPKRPLPEHFSCSSPVSSPSTKAGTLNRGSSFDSVDLSARISISSSLQDIRIMESRPSVRDSIVRFTPKSARYSVSRTDEGKFNGNRRTMSNPNLADNSASVDVDTFKASKRSNSAWNLSKSGRRPPTPPTAAIKRGDQVKIKSSVKAPRHGWGSRGVSHESIGTVLRLLEDQTVAELEFSFLSHFYCAVDELDVISCSRKSVPRHLMNA